MMVTYADAVLLRAALCVKGYLTDSDRLLIAACNAVLYGTDAERAAARRLIQDHRRAA